MPTLGDDMIDYLFHHVFLPPKLPDQHDGSGPKEERLIELVLVSLRLFLEQSHTDHRTAIKAAIGMMANLKSAWNGPEGLQEVDTQRVLQRLCHSEMPEASVVAFHIEAQNAGVILRKTTGSVVFEVFELSPTNVSVNSTRGRLVRQFPATAIAVPSGCFENSNFQSVLIKTLVNMSHQTEKSMKPKAKKAKHFHDEDRDTIHPGVVTELLAGFLLGLGEQVDVPVVFSADSLLSISTPPPPKEYVPFHLALVESWVATNLDTWVVNQIGDERACFGLSRLIRNYHSIGRPWYASRPEGASRMHLVILKLWIAADKIGLRAFPILWDYEPEIP
ncbi:hypothetical protein AK830_g11109 [Neonectria ditissima]|uniref:DUF6606 domain-containing protein n=1 Tax=Neonectria ditissima TaxID=78410 RepID=A0A0P7B4I0_9HYPO|nr:hypothetical protein AK830_g11109 [Neonectria ditissima]